MKNAKNEMALLCSLLLVVLAIPSSAQAAKLVGVQVLDGEYLVVSFCDGEVVFQEGKTGGSSVGGRDYNKVVPYGAPLDTAAAGKADNWTIVSGDDPAYGGQGKRPTAVHRKSKISGMAQMEWDMGANDFRYEAPLAHQVYVKLPTPLKEGKTYTIQISPSLGSDKPSQSLVFDVDEARTEAIHVNLVGYMTHPSVKTVDLYHWMGDGGPRDYSDFVGKDVYLYDVKAKTKQKVGAVRFWKKKANEFGNASLIGSDVWTADFKHDKPGIYRVVIDGIGCSPDFEIADDVYAEPFRTSLKGYYYMRIGEAKRPDIKPIPRQPRYIPGKDPAGFQVVITTVHPWHPKWDGSMWDHAQLLDPYVKEGSPENKNAWGGHSDAKDLDRNLHHVSNIYDLLLPYVLTNGAISDDNVGIPESGNGVPDIIDEARNEVDFWLRLRDGDGYSPGLTCPHNKKNLMYQLGNAPLAAWASAANAAMLADSYRIAKQTDLEAKYLKEAETAFAYAGKQPKSQLGDHIGGGDQPIHGRDLRLIAAAYLFNLTGKLEYEEIVIEGLPKSDSSSITRPQAYAAVAYVLSPQKASSPALQKRLRDIALREAKKTEMKVGKSRPSRRSSVRRNEYWRTAQNVHWTIIAHALNDDPKTRQECLDAICAEADWGLGRNPLNMIEMTTASTPLAKHRSVENIYTTGDNDGTPGLHPGHTPYLNMGNWGAMVMAKPQWMAGKGYPAFAQWPSGECYFNTRWVWAHSEFTPRQTMRGKMALYGYLHALEK